MSAPLISIIVPSYNQGLFIENTILSVIKQSYQNWELIIQDGNSKDSTKEIGEKYMALDKRVFFYSEPDSGFADAVNKAIKKSNGIYCSIQSSDDMYANEKVFEDVINIANNDSGLVIISGSGQYISTDFKLVKNEFYAEKNIEPIDVFTLKAQFAQGSTFFLKKRALEIGLLDTGIDMVADTDFWIRLATINPILKKENTFQSDKIWSYATVHENQRNSSQAPFYLSRARMGVSQFYNNKIAIDVVTKKEMASRLVNAAIQFYCSNGLDCHNLIELDYELNKNKMAFKKRLKILLSKNRIARTIIGYSKNDNQIFPEQQNIQVEKWF